MLRFAEPAFLWCLLLLPAFWALAANLRRSEGARRIAIVAVRTLLVLCLVFALARLEWRRQSKDFAAFFLLDQSNSVPQDLRSEQLALLGELSEKARREDETGVIVFGARPSLETSPAEAFEFEGRILSEVEGDRTDIGSALRLALAAFPGDRMKRIILMSDGNENAGSALEVARFARNSGVPIDVIPLQYDAQNDVRIAKMIVPQRTAKDAPFDLRVFLESQEPTTGRLRIFRDGEVVAEDVITVNPGRNPPLVLSQRLQDGGFHTYSATFEADGDLRPQNNTAQAFTYLKAEPKVLLVEGSDNFNDSIRFLAGALRAENLDVDVGGPEAIPISLDELQRYDALILSNVAASQMSGAQMRLIERGVHDLGVGLVMIGGDQSFGAGGYIDTPIETAMPVSMDVKQKKMLPNGGLVIVLHTAEMANANAWARDIARASLGVLSAQDYFGIVYWGTPPPGTGGGWGDTWAWSPPIAQTGDKKMMFTRIAGLNPGDMPAFDPGLRMAAEELDALRTQTKHIIVISDGDPSPPTKSTVNAIQNAGISVSAVALAPHGGGTVDTMKMLALWGGGEFYYPKTSNELPRIFTKEAMVVRKSLIREETFNPQALDYSEILGGFDSLPPLEGYVITTPKDLATNALITPFDDDPLLAHWRYGLGKSVAFTSDAKNRWAANWVQWGSYAKFWAQTIRWALRETSSPNFQVNTEISGGTGRVTIDAIDEAGNFQNFLDFNATVIGPDFEPADLAVRQAAPGRYEATFPASQVGTYMLSMATETEGGEDAQAQFLTTGVSLSYSPEYETSTSADDFLAKIAEASGGRVITNTANYQPYLRDLPPQRRPEPLWPWLLLIGTVLLPIDVFLRRVYLSWSDGAAWAKEKFLGAIPRREAKQQYEERMDTLRAAKERARQQKEEEQAEAQARREFRERLEDKRGQTGGESVFDRRDAEGPAPPRRQKETFSAEEPTQKPQGEGGMSSLLEAKKRAQKRRKK